MAFWRKAFWRSYWIALRRSGQDRRARIFVLQVSGAIAYVIACIGFILILLFRSQGGGWLFAFYGFIFGTGFIAFLAIRRSHRRDRQLLNFSLSGDAPRTASDAGHASPAVCSYLCRRAAILSTLIGRAGSEMRVLSGNAAGSTRQVHNTWLRQNRLWEELEPNELSLMSKADGTWTQAERDSVVTWCEQLRVLRWALGIDSELMPLEHGPQPDLRLTEGLHEVRSARAINVRTWNVRNERDKAAEYEARLVAEFTARNLLPANAELNTWAGELRDRVSGSSRDYLAGARTVSDLDEATLRLLGAITVARTHYAAWLVDQWGSDRPCSFTEWFRRRF